MRKEDVDRIAHAAAVSISWDAYHEGESGFAISSSDWFDTPLASKIIAGAIEQALAEYREESKKIYRKFAVHMSHCNFGEHSGKCKYGDDDCPALTDSWSWFGRALDRNRKG